jgi:hypothetical protein
MKFGTVKYLLTGVYLKSVFQQILFGSDAL